MTATPGAPRTARERARAELAREIKEEARRQLAAVGANGLSLRAVARELGMVSSALYRYYPSRDDLLTALIIDAYNALGEVVEAAIADVAAGAAPVPGAGTGVAGRLGRVRWLAACHAIRAWALARPHEYALIYGSPVPGYRAPEATIGPAARVPLAFVGVLAGAIADGELAGAGAGGTGRGERAGAVGAGEAFAGGQPGAEPSAGVLAGQAAVLSAALAGQAAVLAATGAPAVPGDVLVRAVIAWTQLFGMISFELFGQFVNSFEPADALFGYATARLASFVGLD